MTRLISERNGWIVTVFVCCREGKPNFRDLLAARGDGRKKEINGVWGRGRKKNTYKIAIVGPIAYWHHPPNRQRFA